MISRKTRLTVIGLIALVFLLLLLWLFWFLLKSEKTTEVEPVQQETQTIDETSTVPSIKEQQLKQEQDMRNQSSGAISVAKMFVERYGSYSNEANFQNLIDVLPLMTVSFAAETNELIAKSKSPETYYGVTTRVLTVNVEKIDEEKGTALIKVNTQREIAKDSPQNTTIETQEILLKLVRLEGIWKVESAVWQ
jgi:hypothetical protein